MDAGLVFGLSGLGEQPRRWHHQPAAAVIADSAQYADVHHKPEVFVCVNAKATAESHRRDVHRCAYRDAIARDSPNTAHQSAADSSKWDHAAVIAPDRLKAAEKL